MKIVVFCVARFFGLKRLCDFFTLLQSCIARYFFFVKGIPRSGTSFTAKFLSELGLLLHNDWGNPQRDGMVSWIHLWNAKDWKGVPGVTQPLIRPNSNLAPFPAASFAEFDCTVKSLRCVECALTTLLTYYDCRGHTPNVARLLKKGSLRGASLPIRANRPSGCGKCSLWL